jgi:hypothetical protein
MYMINVAVPIDCDMSRTKKTVVMNLAVMDFFKIIVSPLPSLYPYYLHPPDL